jgi:hypothetical protein
MTAGAGSPVNGAKNTLDAVANIRRAIGKRNFKTGASG